MKKTITHTAKTMLRNVFTIAAFGGAAVLGVTSSNAGEITGSLHDLSATGVTTGSTSEICVFCHTPHGSDVSAAAPLWNKVLPSTTYNLYSTLGTSTLTGDEAAVGSVSLACLSCHDGTQAMDAILNTPGSGGYNAAGANLLAGTSMTGTPFPNLGADLRNDHPIGIAYGGSTDTVNYKAPQTATINGNSQYWVDTATGTSGTREKTDMMLYTRTTSATTPRVECASCHDPHNGGAGTQTFLRIVNDNSNVCLSCHTK